VLAPRLIGRLVLAPPVVVIALAYIVLAPQHDEPRPAPPPSDGSELAGESRQRGSNSRKHHRLYLHYLHFC
jgi:hypothetical protein